ncbi:uncharacterized protein ACA1_160870, partial [Acanthamoeba castellanii str. Neff]
EVVQGVLVALGDGHQVASSCALVCRQWAALASDPALWKALVHRLLAHLPFQAPLSQVVADRWKEAYFALARRTKHTTVALLGQSHGGKSTLFDLLRALHPLATDDLSKALPTIADKLFSGSPHARAVAGSCCSYKSRAAISPSSTFPIMKKMKKMKMTINLHFGFKCALRQCERRPGVREELFGGTSSEPTVAFSWSLRRKEMRAPDRDSSPWPPSLPESSTSWWQSTKRTAALISGTRAAHAWTNSRASC